MSAGPREAINNGKPERRPGCLFCENLLEQQDGLVLDTDYWRVLTSRDQGYLGRCLVITQRHISSEADLSEEEVLSFHYLKVDLENAATKAFGAKMYNWTELGNDAFQEAEPITHLHHHVRPRYETSVEFMGRTFEDTQFGHMYDLGQRWNVDEDLYALDFKNQVAQALRESF